MYYKINIPIYSIFFFLVFIFQTGNKNVDIKFSAHDDAFLELTPIDNTVLYLKRNI